MTTIGVVIRADKRRERFALALANQLSWVAPTVVSWHDVGRSIPESYADALTRGANLGKTWVLQLEDDISLAPDFWAEALAAVERADPQIGLISFFNRRRPRHDEPVPNVQRPKRLPGAAFIWAQAIAMRSRDVPEHNEYMLRATARAPLRTDNATAWWLASRGYDVAWAWPSLVQHGSLPSLLGHDVRSGPQRDAPSFVKRYS